MTIARLSKDPVLQNQPCATSCVPTCIAMAINICVYDLLEKIAALGIDISKGMSYREQLFLVSSLGLGSEKFLNIGLYLFDGHFLAEVLSLNKMGYTHCVLIHVKDAKATVFDPNNGKSDRSYYPMDSFSELPIITMTHLDDFRDLIENGI